MHRTVGILEFKEIMALEDCKAVCIFCGYKTRIREYY